MSKLPTSRGRVTIARLLLVTALWSACTLERLPLTPLATAESPLPAPSDSPLPAATPTPTPATESAPTPISSPRTGYGINVKGFKYDDDSLDKAIALDWEWIKIYDHPPPERLPFKVLYRVNLPRPDEDWAEWGHYRFLDAQLYADRVDAWEIGNEPNLIEEWGTPPDPAAYAELLQVASREIKAADPDALVVSAGLAPVNARGDPHHLNDLDYLREMYAHGAADHVDVLGVHTFGFGRPPEIAPDGEICPLDNPRRPPYVRVEGPAIDRGCWPVEGLCFRRVEQMRAIMVEYGDEDKPMWATEFGWPIRPLPCCMARSDWPAQYWQTVSEGQQARYLIRAYRYAEQQWPWMEVMFLWNLDWSRYQEQDETCGYCEPMGAYSILDPDGSPRLGYKWLVGERRD